MKIEQNLIPLYHPNRPGIKLETVKAIVIHYTGNSEPGADAMANIKYIGRKYIKKMNTFFEFDTIGFRYGSAHIFCDENCVRQAIPLDEVAWSCGDRPQPYTSVFKGQLPLAKQLFDNRQNYQTISVEICNNENWIKACENAIQFCQWYLSENNLFGKISVGDFSILRHYDLTGKICPKPFVDDLQAWGKFLFRIMNG